MTALFPSIGLAFGIIIGLIFVASLVIEAREGARWRTLAYLLAVVIACLFVIYFSLDALGA